MEKFAKILIRINEKGEPLVGIESDLPPDALIALLQDVLLDLKEKVKLNNPNNVPDKTHRNGSGSPDPS